MWFKLAAANFSAKNLGKMADISNSYSINYNINGFTKTVAPPSVTKGETISEITLTLQENYEMDSIATLSYGSTSVNATVSGSTYKWTNITPTGSVTITAKATWVGTGEEPDDEPIVPTPGTSTTYYFKDQATKGYLFGNVVKDSDTSRTTDYIDISGVSQIGYWGRMGYVEGSTYHALEFYDSNKNYLSSLSVLGTGSPMVKNINLTDSKYANAKYVRASVAQSTYTTAQFNTWYFIVGGSASENNGNSSGNNGGSSGNVTDYFPINEYIAASTHTSASLGEMVSGNGGAAYRTDYIALAGKTTVNYTGRMGTIGCNYAFYDSSKKVIPGLELVGDGATVTKTINLSDSKYANAAYIVASISRGSISDADWAKSYFAIS